MSYFYICSCVKLLALTKSVEKVAAKSQRKESDVKILEEEDDEEKPVVGKPMDKKSVVVAVADVTRHNLKNKLQRVRMKSKM